MTPLKLCDLFLTAPDSRELVRAMERVWESAWAEVEAHPRPCSYRSSGLIRIGVMAQMEIIRRHSTRKNESK